MSIDLTKPVQTRDGRSVRILCIDANCSSGGSDQPIVGVVTGRHCPMAWCLDGQYYGDSETPSDLDLVNVPQPKQTVKVEVRLYRDSDKVWSVSRTSNSTMDWPRMLPVAYTTIEMEYQP